MEQVYHHFGPRELSVGGYSERVTHALGWLFLLLASLIVPRTWQQSAGKISHCQEKAGQFAYGRNPSRVTSTASSSARIAGAAASSPATHVKSCPW